MPTDESMVPFWKIMGKELRHTHYLLAVIKWTWGEKMDGEERGGEELPRVFDCSSRKFPKIVKGAGEAVQLAFNTSEKRKQNGKASEFEGGLRKNTLSTVGNY